ncbi:MAG: 5-deoxy-glucuronate isomerase [bacterium]|nr:5-deoxy-glucuronate isomerase [bacterium]
MAIHKLRSAQGPGRLLEVTPETAGWDVLDFSVEALSAGQSLSAATGDREVAVVPLEGSFTATVGSDTYELERSSVFTSMASVLYLPPGTSCEIKATTDAEFSVGGAPAAGRYPVRLIKPHEMKSEVRGGGGATRQVNHILAHPLPAERLILYEVYVPRGGWSGWPPHCHDGYEESPYLEETYYFRFDPPNGWGIHRNYRVDTEFDEVFSVQDRDVVMVTQGFHSSAAGPGSHMYFLNYLAGTPQNEERAIPPFFQPEYRWIDGNWDVNAMTLPTVGPEGRSG